MLEKVLKEKFELTEKRLEKTSQELTLANAKLKKLDETNSMLMTMASHELKNPLCIVSMYVHLLQPPRTPSPEEITKGLGVIGGSAARLLRLIARLLDISKINLGQAPMNLDRAADLRRVLRSSLFAYRAAAEKKSISIHEDLSGDLSGIYGDEDRLRQAFEILISNAVKYTAPEGKVFIEAKNLSGSVEVKIRDTGIGIEQKYLETIFQPFDRLPSAGLDDDETTGLGLVLVKAILQAHGGSVEILSAPGEGSTFIVSLPKKTPAKTKIPLNDSESVQHNFLLSQ